MNKEKSNSFHFIFLMSVLGIALLFHLFNQQWSDAGYLAIIIMFAYGLEQSQQLTKKILKDWREGIDIWKAEGEWFIHEVKRLETIIRIKDEEITNLKIK